MTARNLARAVVRGLARKTAAERTTVAARSTAPARVLAAAAAATLAAVMAAAPAAHSGDAVDAEGKPAEAPPAFVEKTTERGPVTARVRLEPASPVIGDTVTLLLEVAAEAGVDVSMPEFGQALDRFAVREFVPKEGVDASGRTVSTQRYVLEPPLSGPQAIPPMLLEFVDRRAGQRPAPDGESSYELVTERIPFEVASVVPTGAVADLKPERGRLAPLGEPGSAWPWLAGALVLAAVLAPLAWRRLQQARAAGRRRSAWEVARGRLDVLSSRARPTAADEIDAFFVELSALIRRYLEDRFDLRAPELTTEEFLQVASASPDLVERHQAFLRAFLRRADMVKFARFIPPPAEIEAALAEARLFLDDTGSDGNGGDDTGKSDEAGGQAAATGAAHAGA